MAKDNWELVGTPETWDFAEDGKGAELIGTYIRKREGVGENNSNVYTLKQETGVVSFWGNTILDIRLQDVAIGEEVRLVYKGKATSEKSGRTYHDFDVYHRPAPFEKVDEVNLDDVMREIEN